MKTMLSKFNEAQEIEARNQAMERLVFLRQFKTRTRNRLDRAEIYSNEDLTNKTEAQIQTITHNKKCVNEIKEYLFAKGLCLLMPSE